MTLQAHHRPVLVGIDGTPAGLEALALGSAFAVLTASPLLLAAVFGYEGGAFAVGPLWPPKAEAERWLEDAKQGLGDEIPWSTYTLLSTSPAHGLVTLAKSEGARMIVLGSSHRGPLGHVLAGSTGRQVIHGAPCEVAIAPHDWRMQPPDKPLTIGVAVSDSPEARDALALAAGLAAAAHAPLRVLSAVRLPSPAHPMFGATGTSYAEWCRARQTLAEDIAREALEAAAPGVDAEVVVLEGDPVHRLAEASHDLDLLVVGSRRYGPLRSVLLGGVSGPLIERAACPVVVVPRGVHAEALVGEPAREAAHA